MVERNSEEIIIDGKTYVSTEEVDGIIIAREIPKDPEEKSPSLWDHPGGIIQCPPKTTTRDTVDFEEFLQERRISK